MHTYIHTHTHILYIYSRISCNIFNFSHFFQVQMPAYTLSRYPVKYIAIFPIHIPKLAAIIPIITATLHRVWQRQARKVQGCHEHHENQEIPQRVVHPSIEPDAALPRPIPATGTHVSHCTRIHIRRVLRTLSSSPTLSASLCVSLPLSRFGLKHFFRNCIVNNVVLILESAMFPVFMGLMLLFIGPQCCIRPRPAPNYGSCVVGVRLALAWGHLRLLPLIFDKEMHFAWRSSFFSGLTPFPTFPLASSAFDTADK